MENLQAEAAPEKKESFDEFNIKLTKLFDEKKKHLSELKTFIESFRTYKKERNELNEKVKENKTKRDALKTELNSVLGQFRSAKEKAGEFTNPGRIRSEIERIEWKIQTEIMPFKKEQELTKQRLILEEELKKAIESMEGKKELSKLRTDLTLKIAEERNFHDDVLKFAKESAEKHKLSVDTLQKIKESRKRLKEIFAEISVLKEKIGGLRKERAEQYAEEKKKDMSEKQKAAAEEKQEISEKLQEVKEKFAKKKKLTTEDLLLIQGAKEDII